MKSILISITVLFAALFVAAALAEPTTQPESDGTSVINGTLSKDGQPLPHVTVRLTQSNDPANTATVDKNDKAAKKAARKAGQGKRVVIAETTTDDKGNFSFTNIRAGQYIVVYRDREGGVGGATPISVTDHQTATVSVTAAAKKSKNK